MWSDVDIFGKGDNPSGTGFMDRCRCEGCTAAPVLCSGWLGPALGMRFHVHVHVYAVLQCCGHVCVTGRYAQQALEGEGCLTTPSLDRYHLVVLTYHTLWSHFAQSPVTLFCATMSSPTPSQVRSLFRSLLREGRKFPNYNVRE